MQLEFELGDPATVCGPNDNPCNGPLKAASQYKIRYQLFSGTAVADYDFFDATFSTGSYYDLPLSKCTLLSNLFTDKGELCWFSNCLYIKWWVYIHCS